MNPLLTCEDVLRLIPDYQERELTSSLRLRFSLHLKMCKPCRMMLESLQAIPQILQRAIAAAETPAPTPEARRALEKVMARLQDGGRLATLNRTSHAERRSTHSIPASVEKAVSEGTADLPMRLMAQAHAAIQAQGFALAREPFLPESVLKELRPFEQWKWTKALLNGCSSARLTKDPDTGASLYMILMPRGRRFPDHQHQGDEQVLVLSGQVEDSQFYGVAGDWFDHASGTSHHELQARGTDACWTLSRMEDPGVRLSGWRGALQSIVE